MEPNRLGVQEPIPDVEVALYYVETLVPTPENATLPNADEVAAAAADASGLYLLDLMRAQGYRVVSGVWHEVIEPGIAEYPHGWALLRACAYVQEFDAEVG